MPEHLKTEDLIDLIEWLGELVRQVDSSLLDEWEKLANPSEALEQRDELESKLRPVTANARALPGAGAQRDVPDGGAGRARPAGDAARRCTRTSTGRPALDAYYDEHDTIGTGPSARGPAFLRIEEEAGVWRVRQVIEDPNGDGDWGVAADVDLAASDEEGTAVLHVVGINRL